MNRIRELRIAAEMRQEDLAQHLNVSKVTVSRYELESRHLDPATIHQLCDLFGCTADYLLGRSEDPEPAVTPEDARVLRAYHAAEDRDRAFIDHLLGLDQPEKKRRADAS